MNEPTLSPKIKTLFVFLIPWPAVCLLYAVLGRLNLNTSLLWIILIPELFCVLGWIALYLLHDKTPSKIPVVMTWGMLLALADQIIKLLVHNLYGWNRVTVIIPQAFTFRITPNHHGSFIASLLDVKVSGVFYVIFYIAAGYILFRTIQFFTKRNGNTGWINLGRIFFLATIAAASADRIIWNYTLDYIAVEEMFVFDLKDLFANLSALSVFCEMVENPSGRENPFKGSDDWKEYFRFLLPVFRRRS
ncbi:MAG: signal peptidase II [Spirochaetia bacterium]